MLVRDPARERRGIDPALSPTEPARVLDDPSVAIVVEVMGGVEPTLGYLRRALARGASVVTANKQLLSRHGPELLRAAEEAGRRAALRGVGLRGHPGHQGAARVAAGGRDRGG